jgi:hypothetical protein
LGRRQGEDSSGASRMQIIRKAEALSRGLKRYFTGKQCVHGHRSERYIGSGHCVKCSNVRDERRRADRRFREENAARTRKARRRREMKGLCRECEAKATKGRYCAVHYKLWKYRVAAKSSMATTRGAGRRSATAQRSRSAMASRVKSAGTHKRIRRARRRSLSRPA